MTSKLPLLFVLIFASCIFAQRSAVAVLQSTTNGNFGISGIVSFTETENGDVTVHVELSGLAGYPSELGIHLHNWGDITDNSGSAAGPHWIGSGSSSHGCPPSSNRHEGDLGSWEVSNGEIDQMKTLDLISLSGTTSVIGRGVILHDIPDPCDDSSTGARIAMGVIGIANESNNQAKQDINPDTLICKLQSTTHCPGCSGSVWFEKKSSFVKVTAQIFGLQFGDVHGIHVHEFGDVTDAEFGLSLGSHYNPDNRNHGLPSNPNRHEGDMGNIQSYDSDSAWYEYENELFSSTGSLVGRGVVLHETRDNGNGNGCGTTGNSGLRYATCVIGVASDEISIPSVPIIVDTNFSNQDCVESNSIATTTASNIQTSFSPSNSFTTSRNSDGDDSSSNNSTNDDDSDSSSSASFLVAPATIVLVSVLTTLL